MVLLVLVITGLILGIAISNQSDDEGDNDDDPDVKDNWYTREFIYAADLTINDEYTYDYAGSTAQNPSTC